MLKNLSCVAALLPTMREENVVALLLQVMHFTSAPHAGRQVAHSSFFCVQSL